MIPVYFPFTFIPKSVADLFSSTFGRVVVYQPNSLRIPQNLSELADNKSIEIRTPINGDEDRLNILHHDYVKWGTLHDVGFSTFKASVHDDAEDEEFAVQIRSQIAKQKADTPLASDDAFSNRLFLQMAQDFDMQQYDIDRQLQLSEAKKRAMFSNLSGGEDNIKCTDYLPLQDYGAYLTTKRICAWVRIYQADHDASPFLLTNSLSSFHHVIECAPASEVVCAWEDMLRLSKDNSCERLPDFLDNLARTPFVKDDSGIAPAVPTGIRGEFRIKLCILPDMPPEKLTAELIGDTGSNGHLKSGYLNTLVGLLEMIN